jgi:hypothetical protein
MGFCSGLISPIVSYQIITEDPGRLASLLWEKQRMGICHIGRPGLFGMGDSEAYAHSFCRPVLKSENGAMWSELVTTVTPPSALIGERNVHYAGAIADMMCTDA